MLQLQQAPFTLITTLAECRPQHVGMTASEASTEQLAQRVVLQAGNLLESGCYTTIILRELRVNQNA